MENPCYTMMIRQEIRLTLVTGLRGLSSPLESEGFSLTGISEAKTKNSSRLPRRGHKNYYYLFWFV